jgi:hypothetical protein
VSVSATRRTDSEEFGRLQAAAREIRETVADQLHDLVIERDSFANDDEVTAGVRQIGEIAKLLREARGRQAQAREMGLPVSGAVSQEQDALRMLRSAVVSLGASCGAFAARLDFESRRAELEAAAARVVKRNGADENI